MVVATRFSFAAVRVLITTKCVAFTPLSIIEVIKASPTLAAVIVAITIRSYVAFFPKSKREHRHKKKKGQNEAIFSHARYHTFDEQETGNESDTVLFRVLVPKLPRFSYLDRSDTVLFRVLVPKLPRFSYLDR